MWINYTDSEVKVYHPICEKALNAALKTLKLNDKYQILHHKRIGSLEMDFAICNKQTGKYLCVIEVKRTKSAVESTRYQYQAMSYVQMAGNDMEKPFYILTNLEYAYVYRYDSKRTRVIQQILNPGLVYIDLFKNNDKKQFMKKLIEFFKIQIETFIKEECSYYNDLDDVVKYISDNINDKIQWKTSFAVLFYEYIRGALDAVDRKNLNDIRKFRTDIKGLCEEINYIGFNEIFKYDEKKYLSKYQINSDLLKKMYSFGKVNISADSICNALYQSISQENRHDGKVATDVELSNILAILAKSVYGQEEIKGIVCDPAAGSGILLSSAINLLGLEPNQIFANDIDIYVEELLSIRLGLSFPKVINNKNFPIIKNKDVCDLDKDDFKEVSIILLNPPYIAGISCIEEKKKIVQAIEKNTKGVSKTNIGQAGLQFVFIELITSLVENDTVIACIIPKQDLIATGKEASMFRKFLIQEFGLQVIFNYPGENLFNNVTKDTCILVGKKKSKSEEVKVFSSLDNIDQLDYIEFSNVINNELNVNNFKSLMPGIEGMKTYKYDLLDKINEGWRLLSSDLEEAINFINNIIMGLDCMISIDMIGKQVYRGKVGNSGGTDLVYISSNKKLYGLFKNRIDKLSVGLRNAKLDNLILNDGDAKFLNVNHIEGRLIDEIISNYVPKKCEQAKKVKTHDELKKILQSDAKRYTKKYSVLIPRNLRAKGRVYINTCEMYITTNFVIIECEDIKVANVIASWCSSIFYQLECEVLSKNQEGARKMEWFEVSQTHMPSISKITDEEYKELEKLVPEIQFVDLKEPEIREIDIFWAKILFGENFNENLKKAQKLLKFTAQRRDSKNNKKFEN